MSGIVFGKFGKESGEKYIKASVNERAQDFLVNGDEVEHFDYLCDLHENVEFNELLFEMIKTAYVDAAALDDVVVDVVSFALDVLKERFEEE